MVRRSKVKEENLIEGKNQTCVLADGSRIKVPVAQVFITTPFLKGQYEVWCMDNPVYDLIVGNVPDAKPANRPDPEWQVHAVETRQQKRAKDKPYPQLKVPSLIAQDVDPVIMREAQEHDTSLAKVRSYAQDNVTQVKKNGKVSWFKKNGLLFRQYITQGGDQEKVYSQLVHVYSCKVPRHSNETCPYFFVGRSSWNAADGKKSYFGVLLARSSK